MRLKVKVKVKVRVRVRVRVSVEVARQTAATHAESSDSCRIKVVVQMGLFKSLR